MTISVIIPAYNAAPWVARAIESVLAQTRPPEEIVVIDDGSTDGTAQECARFDGRVRVVRRDNGGLSAARNTGLAATSGEWFLSLDADDILYPQALEVLAARASPNDAGVVYGFVLQRREPATETRLHSLPYAVGLPPAPAKAAFWWTPVATLGSALVRRDLNEAVGGFDENFRQVEDAEYWLRCGVTAAFVHCNQIVLDKSCSPNSLGQNSARSIWYRLQLQRKFLLWCERRCIDTSFLEATPADMIDHALKRIHTENAWDALKPVLAQAKEMGVRTPWNWKATLTAALLRPGTVRPPGSFPVVYSLWLDELP